MIDHVSFSQLNMLLNCGIQYDFRYVQGIKIPPAAAVIRGACGHRTNERNFRQKIESRIDLPKEEILATFSDEWEKGKYGIAWREEELAGDSVAKAEGKWKDSGIGLIGKYHEEQAPLVQPVLIEEKFRVEFHGDFPPLDGIIDRITEDESVEDDKFVGKTPPEDDALKDVQLTCYHLGYRAKFGKDPKALRKRFAVDLKTPKTVVREAPPREKAQLDRFLFRLEAGMKSIKSGIFLPAANGSWICSERWCGFFFLCKYHV